MLGDHFHPLLILLGPIWALWPSGLAVMITQDALLGLGAGILAGFGTRFLRTLLAQQLRGMAQGEAPAPGPARDLVEQATQGRFSKLVVRDGALEMIDAGIEHQHGLEANDVIH